MSLFISVPLFYLFCDIYTFFGLKGLFKSKGKKYTFYLVYLLSAIFAWYCFYMVYDIAHNRGMFSGTAVNFYLGAFLTAMATKLTFTVLMLLQDLPLILIGLGRRINSAFSGISRTSGYVPSRRKTLTMLATGIAAIPFATMLYGVTKGKYKYTIKNVPLGFSNLPASFKGYRIVQISDVHAGSFDSPEQVLKGIEMINALEADAIVFTGDLVNSNKDEIDPYIDIFSKLKAKDGKYAVLGNHDYYGLYDVSEDDKLSYWEDFYKKFEAMGFDLLNNANRAITKDGAKINIVGVENWGKSRYFPKEADLDKALEGIDDKEFCVLLSHDPTHWEEKVIDHSRHIDLTLSGHTHGFQFGFSFPGFEWSPAKYRYPRWKGLHESKNQKMYINTGFGFLAFPGRVGMWPEITVFELDLA